MNYLFRKKDIEDISNTNQSKKLKRSLGAFDLILMGMGATIGTGVLVITGLVAARNSGPAISLSFILSAIVCGLVALCYAEFASAIPSSGSAYAYTYVALGEIVAYLVGWSIVGGYTVSIASVAGGWSAYFNSALTQVGIYLPSKLITTPSEGGLINLPAVFIVICMSYLLTRGLTESKKVNNIAVGIKISIVLLFIIIGAFFIEPENWNPFMPFGMGGVFAGAASVFFAFTGFDAISTSAEEVKDPQRNLPRGILGSLLACTIIYVILGSILTGMVSYKELNVGDALAYALDSVGQGWAAVILSVGAVIGIIAVLFAYMFAVPRVLLSMSRDGLLPKLFSTVNSKTHVPTSSTWMICLLGAIVSGLIDLKELADIANMAAILNFALVALSVIVLRKTQPNLKRNFKMPFVPILPILAILFCLFLAFNLSVKTWIYYFSWIAVGLLIYFSYSRNKSILKHRE
ncbi:APC family permease [Brevibacillus laterosporus]|uniref:APC family permease n=1 Tax=Brevibacillus laterosporus TaxID=1465 RepID=UPI001EF30CD3|nr:amino acid permease [Brevibacillus laterosporus]MCG7320279.1 amino acid permease [Brevibacillus laterosporus]